MTDHFEPGTRVRAEETGEIPEQFGYVDRDHGGAVVHIFFDGQDTRYPHNATPVPREQVHAVVEEDEED
jgi:hypothetical protein